MTEPELHPLLNAMRAMRDEMAAIREQNAATFKRLGDVLNVVRQIQGDVTLLENHNLTRHNEIMAIVARLDKQEIGT